MYALTLYQPYASLVAEAIKTIETRSWSTAYRGPILIHAAKRFPRAYQRLRGHMPFPQALKLPRGAVVAVAHLSWVEHAEDRLALWLSHRVGTVWNWHEEREFRCGDYRQGRYAWHLAKIRPLRRPIPAIGRQRLWRPSTALIAKVRRQVAV